MDVDRVVRWTALALIPALGVGLWLSRSPAPAPVEPAPDGAEERAPITGLPPTGQTSPLSAAVRERGEAALGTAATPPSSQAAAQPTLPPAVRRIPKPPSPPHAAADLPLADDAFGSVSAPRAPKREGERERRGACGGIEARAITASPDPEWAFASLSASPGESAKLRRVGDSVGSYRVDSIEWDRVWLKSGGGRCAAVLHDVGPAAGPGLPDVDLPGDEPWRLGAELAQAIEGDGAARYVVDGGVLDALFERGAELLSGITLTPRVEQERIRGVAIDGVREASLLGHLGVENGDILLSLDGREVSTAAAIADALSTARRERRLVASFERGSKTRRLELTVL